MRDALSIWSRRGILALALFAGAAGAADRHLGVATCAGSTCHGATRAFADRVIRQDEYFVWQNQDRHARAYRSLETPRAQAIARRLGLKSATQAAECLGCHAPVPAERGARFRVEDGVGCEACHGPAERWLQPHAAGFKTLGERTALGMTPLWEPAARATLCLSCHQGDADRPVTHALMAAGHPPLLFELDTFVALMPPHHAVDADYQARKPRIDAAQQWLQGQVAAADSYLARLARMDGAAGLFPDFAAFDCDACHHRTDAARASPGRVPGQMPGTVPLADQSLVLLGAWLEVVDAPLAQRWREARSSLYAAGGAGPLAAAAEAQRQLLLRELRPRAGKALDPRQLRSLLRGIAASGAGVHGGDFRYAEQAAMASAVLAAALRESGQAPSGLKPASDALYAQVASRERFDPRAWREACTRLQKLL